MKPYVLIESTIRIWTNQGINAIVIDEKSVKAGLTLREFKSNSYRWLIAAIFVLYGAVLFYLVFLSDAYGRNNSEILRYQNINLVPFKTIKNYLHAWEVVNPLVVITNIYGNIAAFIPFGFLGPVVLGRLRTFKGLFFYGFLMSFSIEVIQGTLGVGVVDVDDLILNVFGAVIGYGFYVVFFKKFRKKNEG